MSAADLFRTEAAKRILVNDGGFGTEIQCWKFNEAAYAGELGLSRDQVSRRSFPIAAVRFGGAQR